ncbi:MAG: helix-turn-helix domain-containing protein [Chromatiales bacterium]
MALLHLGFDKIDEGHLQRLIEIGAAESREIEYKRQTYGKNDDAKTEFLADISSFANTIGGDLIIGMTASKGVPMAFEPWTTMPSY